MNKKSPCLFESFFNNLLGLGIDELLYSANATSAG